VTYVAFPLGELVCHWLVARSRIAEARVQELESENAALVSTVAGICLFFAGLRRVGPAAASILSTLEPVVAVALAFAAFGESLGAAQLAGGALVLLAVLVVRAPRWPRRRNRPAHVIRATA